MKLGSITTVVKRRTFPKKWGYIVSILISVFSLYFVISKVLADSPVTTIWDFSNTSEYIVGDTSSLEIISGTAQLKVLEYSSDSNTSALFHFNETSGSDPSDSSSYGLSANGYNISWSEDGKLNGGIIFDGSKSQVIISDTAAISLLQQNTIEAWIKPDSAFHADNDTGGTHRRMGIVDKGTYKLYLDSDTGKLTYELADDSKVLWEQIGGQRSDYTVVEGGWDLNGQAAVSSIVTSGNIVYVGIGTPVGTTPGDAEVWEYNTSTNTWRKIGGDGTGLSPSEYGWADGSYEDVTAMTIGDGELYIGLGNGVGDGEVWKYNGSEWEKIGGDGSGATPSEDGWGPTYIEQVWGLVYLEDILYASLGNSSGDAEIWSYDGSNWTKMGGDGMGWAVGGGYEMAYTMTTDGTSLFVGLASSQGDAELYKYSSDTWSKIGGDGTGWANSTYEAVTALYADSSQILVGLGHGAGDADLFRYLYSTSAWSQIGGDGTGWTAGGYENILAITTSGPDIYIGLGNGNNKAEVYKYSGGTSTWEKIGGDATNKGWSASNYYYQVKSLAFLDGYLYAGIYQYPGTSNGTGELWKYDNTSWSLIGGEYVNKSWGYSGFNSVESIVQNGDNLYVGMGLTSSSAANISDAVVFEYDGNKFNLIGGQGINSGWGNPIYGAVEHEAVTSMVSYKGDLYIGLGSGAGDAEIWMWDESKWNFIAGDGTGWAGATYETVLSMIEYNGLLYVGLGNSRGDGDVYSYDGENWEKIGGDGTGFATNTYEQVLSMSVFQGKLFIGLGTSTGDGEVWSYDGSTWTQVGGDGTGLAVGVYEGVYSMVVYKGELYVGTGLTAGDAEVYKYDGSTWTHVGGDNNVYDVEDSEFGWDTSGNYERVKSMVVYNGELYASLGLSAGDGEVWKYDGYTWDKVGGDASASGWSAGVEEVSSMAVYKGRLYAGAGLTANADAGLWAYGENAFLQSERTTWDTDWYHVAATYDGETAYIFVNGVLDSSAPWADLSMANTVSDLMIGTTYGERKVSGAQGYFDGIIDEVRISNIARTSFNTKPYSSDPQIISASSPAWGYGVGGIGSFVSLSANTNGLGSIEYRLSTDRGTTWKWWDGDGWDTSDSTDESNTESEINDHIGELEITDYGITWQAVLEGNGDEQVKLNSISITALDDTENPTPPDSVNTTFTVSGSQINPESFPDGNPDINTWYNSAPTFTLSGADDTGGAGIGGYWVYLGADSSATPATNINSTFYSSSSSSLSITVDNLNSGSSYYLRVQTKDKAQRLSGIYAPLIYRFDNTPPSNPAEVTVSPSTRTGNNEYTFTWPYLGSDAAYDCKTTGGVIDDSIGCAGLYGYQYKTGASSGEFSVWSDVITDHSVYLSSAAYQDDNIFYLRSVDAAGNVALSTVQKTYLYAGSAPTKPTNLTVEPESSSSNSFAFEWDIPESFSGEEDALTYCYTINVKPSLEQCSDDSSWISAEALAPDAFANMPGTNTFYVVARDEAHNVNYREYAEINFDANTAAPGIPRTVEIADVSVKTTSSWKLATSWEPPTGATGDLSYEVYHSIDGEDYDYEATTTGIAFVSTGLTQVDHYYKIRACDNTNNCGAFTEPVSMLPTGRYTSPPELMDDPEVTDITTKKATITWATDRSCDTKVQYGTSSDDYFDEEPSNSNQTTAHEINLDNLDPGTKYYVTAKWTDEDGNTGMSEEFEFETEPAPTVTDPGVKTAGIASVVLQYTVKDASKVRIYYGKTTAFGGTVELSTSTDETTYNTTIDVLEDGTKYFYKINTFDTEDDEYEGNILSFETLPRPRIADVRVQQVIGTAQPTVLVSWSTNTDTSSIVTYYPEGNTGSARDEVNVALTKGEHRMLIRGLVSQTPYVLIVKGRDVAGNEASSDAQRFNTASDTRPPIVSNLKVEGTIVSSADGVQTAQLVVSWDTDEGATSQVEYGEGTGVTYAQKTQEDSSLTFNHVVVISGLTPSKVYHLKAISKDKAVNIGSSVDTVVITPKSTDSAMNLVITNLQQVFGFLGELNK